MERVLQPITTLYPSLRALVGVSCRLCLQSLHTETIHTKYRDLLATHITNLSQNLKPTCRLPYMIFGDRNQGCPSPCYDFIKGREFGIVNVDLQRSRAFPLKKEKMTSIFQGSHNSKQLMYFDRAVCHGVLVMISAAAYSLRQKGTMHDIDTRFDDVSQRPTQIGSA